MSEKYRGRALSGESRLPFAPVDEQGSNSDAGLSLPEPSVLIPWKDLREETLHSLRPYALEKDLVYENFSDAKIEAKSSLIANSSVRTINIGRKRQHVCKNRSSEYVCGRYLNHAQSDVGVMGNKSSRNSCHNDNTLTSNPCDNRVRSPSIDLSDQNNSFDDQMHEKLTESPLTARIPSPSSASSITSGKRLEWDSGADVGYIFSHDNYTNTNENLSTIERIALVHGCSAALFKRLDPEGTSGPPKPVTNIQCSNITFNSPVANSTPVSRGENLLNSKLKDSEPLVEQAETVLPGGCLFLHCDKEFENDVAPGKRSSEDKCSSDEENSYKTDNLHKKHSNSLINLRSDLENIVQSSLPRSQSFLNLARDKYKLQKSGNGFHELQQPHTLAATCSVSSSSVATIVQKPAAPMTCDKIIQTLPLKLSVGVQVNENTDLIPLSYSSKVVSVSRNTNFEQEIVKGTSSTKSSSVYEKQKDTISDKCDNSKCTGAHKRNLNDNGICTSDKKEDFDLSFNVGHNIMIQVLSQMNKDNGNSENSTLNKSCLNCDQEIGSSESATSGSQTGESYEAHRSRTRTKHESLHNSIAIVDSANSFEYLPGEVFEQSQIGKKSTSSRKSSRENLSSTVPSGVNKSHSTRSNSESSSLAKGVEEGVELLQKLISGKAYNGKTKKKLIQEIVNKLVDSDHNINILGKVSDQSSRSSVVAHDSPKAVITNVLKQHLGSGDWSERSNKSFGRSSLQSCGDSKTATPVSGSVSVPGDNEQSKEESSALSSVSFSNNSKRNWKTPTSRSEKIFESQFLGDESEVSSNYTPPLLKLCRTEHVKQLEWIKFEINHLSHLKQLLEKQEGITKTLSKLASQDHKAHQIKKAYSKPSSCRPERNNCEEPNNWRNKSEKYNTTSETSRSGGYNGSSTTSHESKASDACSSRKSLEERDMQNLRLRQRSSPRSLTQDSYILSASGIKSDPKALVNNGSSRERGQLNVFVQACPKSKETSCQTSVPRNAFVNVLQETATSSHESRETAMKCCCECKRALEAIALRQKQNPSTGHEHIHKFCKCHVMSVNPNPENDVPCSDYLSTSMYDFHDAEKEKVFHGKNDGPEELSVPKSSNSGHRKENIKKFIDVDNDQRQQKVSCPCCGCIETHPMLSEEFAGNTHNSKSERNKSAGNRNMCSDAVVQADIKEPLAYLLTFEPTSSENKERQRSLPEIKLLIPACQNVEKNEESKTSVAIGSGNSCKENQCPMKINQNAKPVSEHLLDTKVKKNRKLTLQECLKANRPDYIQHADKRSQCLADLALLRDMRKQKRLELMKLTHQPESTETKDTTSDERVILTGASVPGKRLFTSRSMRDQARKKYQRTKEVQNKLAERKKKEDFRTNRLMAELFTKNLQKQALKGVINHSYTASVSSC